MLTLVYQASLLDDKSCLTIYSLYCVTMMTGLVECYMAAKRHKEALTVAKNAHKTLGANPRTLTVGWTVRSLLELAAKL